MLEPAGRLVLADSLRPPAGYTLDRAVATTFTLDFTAALVAPLSLGSMAAGEHADPITIMESIRSVADRVDVFCQAGNIVVPAQASDLVAFLEPLVHQVRRPRPGRLFHPKIWLLRYVHEHDPTDIQLRFLCGSRNLTMDKAWDLMLCLDGAPTSETDERNRPLFDLIRQLPSMATRRLARQRRVGITSLADSVLTAEWELPADVNDLDFHVFGIADQDPPDFTGTRHLVISPFVTADGLEEITTGSDGATIVSRVEELAKIEPSEVEAFDLFTVNSLAELEAHDDIETGGSAGEITMSGLHAKAVVVDYGRTTHMFVGSLNATHAALHGNVEVMVELIGPKSRIGIDRLLGDATSFGSLLEPYSAVEFSPNDDDWSLEEELRAVAESPFRLTIEPGRVAESGYSLGLTCDAFPQLDPLTVATASLLTRAGTRLPLPPQDAQFDQIPLVDITPFLTLRLQRGSDVVSTVVRAELIGDPSGRLDAVLARQVDTPEKLLRFLLLILQLGNNTIDFTPASGTGAGTWQHLLATSGAGLFELIVKTLAERPDALDDIERLITRMERTDEGKELLPPGFSTFWSEIRTARDQLHAVTP